MARCTSSCRGRRQIVLLGYDLEDSDERGVGPRGTVWDPIRDYRAMKRNAGRFTGLFRPLKPTICRVQGHAVAVAVGAVSPCVAICW